MIFLNPHFLYFLSIIPLLTAWFIYSRILRKKQLKKLGNPAIITQLIPNISFFRSYLKFGLMMLALSFLIVALARPKFGQQTETIKSEGLDVMIAIDISRSMLAKDVQPNRLSKAKQMLEQLLSRMENNRVGLVVFAGDAFVQMPITADYAAANIFLTSITTDLIDAQGTAIGAAIERSLASFDPNSRTGKAIILITDGENHEADAITQAENAAEAGVKLIIAGIGTTEGTTVPLSESSSDFLKDRQGNTVVSRLNEAMAKEIAAAGEGIYMNVNRTDAAISDIQSSLAELEKTTNLMQNYKEQSIFFLVMAFICLVAEVLIPKSKENRKKKSFSA
jgi:Ca-activated chloride channel family protein